MHGMHTQVPANRLKELREAKGLTLMDLASACSVYPTTVYRWERAVIPQEHLPQLAATLGTDVPFLAGWTEKQSAA